MIAILVTAMLMILSGIAYRIRGSDLFSTLPKWFFGLRGDRLMKLAVGATPVAVAIHLAGASWIMSSAVLVGVILTDTLPHASFQGAVGLKQRLGMSALGVASAMAPAMAMTHMDGWHMGLGTLILGALCGPSYVIGNRIPIDFTVAGIGFQRGPPMGEFIYGLTRVVFISLAST